MLVYSLNLWRHFLNRDFPFSDDMNLRQVDIKLSRTSFFRHKRCKSELWSLVSMILKGNQDSQWMARLACLKGGTERHCMKLTRWSLKYNVVSQGFWRCQDHETYAKLAVETAAIEKLCILKKRRKRRVWLPKPFDYESTMLYMVGNGGPLWM